MCANPWPCVRSDAHEGGVTGRGCVHHGMTDDVGNHGRHSDEHEDY